MLKGEIQDCGVYRFTIEDGVKGDKGLSAYEVAVQEGFVGTIDEWLESLVGPPVPVAQELGDDPNLAVSQKLLKDSIDSMEQSNSDAVAEAERLNDLSQQAASSAAESESNASASAESADSSALSAAQSARESASSAEQSLQSASSSESSARSAASSAQSASESASSAGVSAEQASLAAVAADGSASKAKQSELSATGSAERSEASANSASTSATQAEQSAQSSAISAQGSADSAELAAASALAAKASEDSAKGSAEQAESSAKRADAVAEIVEDKFDKSKVVGELGDRDDLVINQARVTLELNTLYRQIELLTAWSGHEIPKQPLYADFIGQRYAKDGKPCRFEDIFELIRLSLAWQFEGGKLEEYGINEPRFSGKGLLIEPERTNYATRSMFKSNSNFDVVDNGETIRLTCISPVNQYSAGYPQGAVGENYIVSQSITYKSFNNSIGIGGSHARSTIIDNSGLIESKVPSNEQLQLYTEELNMINNVLFVGDANATNKNMRVFGGSISQSHPWQDYFTFDVGDYVEFFSVDYELKINTTIDKMDNHRMLSTIKFGNTPRTRLSETLTVLTDSGFILEADEGIQVNGNEITGFGYIRKLEVK